MGAINMSKDKFLRGALILTVAGLLVKVIGSVNRILLSRLLGGEGIGLYQMAYPIYLLMLSVCSAGVPVAVSIIVAEKVAKNDYAQAHRVFKVTLRLMAVFGLFFALTLYGLAGYLVSSVRLNHVGRVETAAATHLDNGYVDFFFCKIVKRHACRHLEKRELHLLKLGFVAVDEVDNALFVNHLAIHTDSLAEVKQVRGGV